MLKEANEQATDGDDDPIDWPLALAGDKGYRADGIDQTLSDMEIQQVIPSQANQDRGPRPAEFDPDADRQRNVIERLMGWLLDGMAQRISSRFLTI